MATRGISRSGRGRSTANPFSSGLDNTQGLYNLASQSGFKSDADRIVAKNAGETNQLFSGGLVSDFFDVLNALDYGVVGMAKGKSFLEGVQNRESFMDEDALGKYGWGGKVLGLGLDIALDPLTYIAPATILEKVPGLTKLGKATKTALFGKMVEKTIGGKTMEVLEGGIKFGKQLADKFSFMFGKDKVYKDAWIRKEIAIAKSGGAVKQMAKGILNLDSKASRKLLELGEDFRFDRANLGKLKGVLTDEQIGEVARFGQHIDDLGAEEVRLGLLSKETYEANKGKYLKAFYNKYELTEKKSLFGFKKSKIIGNKARKDLTKEQIENLGRIENPAYIFSKTALSMINDIENTKFFNEVADKFGSKTAQVGFEPIRAGAKTLGSLAGKYVPKAIFDDVTALTKPASELETKWLRPLVNTFKKFKVIFNPATHVRNVISNKLLNNFDEAGMPLWRLDKDMQGWKSVITKDKWFKEVEELGGAFDTFSAQELTDLISPKNFMGKFAEPLRKLDGFMTDLYQREELGAKMSMYIFQRTTKGLSKEEAWKIAERATFNYAQVTPFIRSLRQSIFGFPFITFTVKATPVIGKTVLTHPTKISNIGKIRNAIEGLANIKETEAERASEPSWVKNGFYVKLPIKDKYGRSAYFDLTYILPFGDLANLGDETSLNIFKKSPALNLITEIGNNKDFYGNKIWRDSDPSEKQLGDLMRHLTKTMLPPTASDLIPGGYNPETGEQRKNVWGRTFESSDANTNKTLMQEMARAVGMKIQPMNADIQETYKDWNIRKDLKTLLKERGIIRDLNVPYVPKSK